MSSENIWYILQLSPGDDRHQYKLLGKIWLDGDHLTVLEDHGIGHDLANMTPQAATRAVMKMKSSQRRVIANAALVEAGHYPELDQALGRSVEQDMGPKISIFDYHREGMPAPQILKIHGEQGFLDDHRLEPHELDLIMANAQSGKATLRHHLGKGESLLKIEKHLMDALGQVREAVKLGHVHPDSLKTLNRTIFADTMIPSMGNKVAYQDFLSRPRTGVHIHLDGNDFGSINKTHDHETGNQAIIAMGKALRESLDESVGRKNGKLFRTGGDEFIAHVPSGEHAALFARTLRSKLDAIPPVKGTHKLSMSLGFGPSSEHAEEGLKQAKAQKIASGAAKGMAGTHVVNNMAVVPPVNPVE